MKKFYAVAAFMLCAIVAFAAPKSAKVDAVAIQKLQKMQIAMVDKSADQNVAGYTVQRRSYTDNKGNEWQLVMSPWMGFWEVFKGAEFTDYPFMCVTVQLDNLSTGNEYCYIACWPTKACDAKYLLEERTEDEDYDIAAAIADMGEEVAMQPMGIEEAIVAKNAYYEEEYYKWVVPQNADEEGYVTWNWFGCVCPDFCEMVGLEGEVNGKEAYTGSGEEGWFELKSFDNSTQVANIIFNATMYDASHGGAAIGNLYCDFNGSITAIGFSHIQKELAFAEAHLFNVGVVDYDNAPYGVCFLEEFDPVHMFYFAACGPSMVYDYPGNVGTPAQTSSGTITYDAETLPKQPLFAAQDESGIFWYYGAFYAAEDASDETGYQGKFDLPKDFEWDYAYTPNGSIAGVNNGPVAGQFIPGGYTFGACDYAVRGLAMYPYYSFPEIGKYSAIGFGGENGFWGNIEDSKNINALWSYTSDMVYHYDPTDFLKFKMIDPTEGDDAVKALFGDNADVVSSQYYNLQGVRLSAAPVKGAYIVRNTLSNGKVVAKKVVK